MITLQNMLLLVLRVVPLFVFPCGFVLISITSGAFGHRIHLEFKTKHVFDSLLNLFHYTTPFANYKPNLTDEKGVI